MARISPRMIAILAIAAVVVAAVVFNPFLLFFIVPLAIATAGGWLIVKLLPKTRPGRWITDRYSTAGVWFVGLSALAVAGIGSALGLIVGISLISSDPCVNDWDIVCTTPWGERLSQLSILAFPLYMVGQGAAIAAFVIGAFLVGKKITRSRQQRGPALGISN